MKFKRILMALAGIALVAVALGTWWWQWAGEQRELVATALPAEPEVNPGATALREALAAAESEARSRFGAKKGLAALSRLYHANGFLEAAMRCYEGLEQLEPAEPRWLHLHATILAGYGEIEPALARWQRVIALAPDYVPARLRLADCELKTNREAEAAAAYQAVLQREPANAYAMLGLARIDFEAGRLGPARERLETIVAQTNFALGYDLIVSLYERTGETARAAAIRGAAKASGAYRDPPDPWVDELLEACYDPYRLALTAGVIAHTGGPDKAVQLLERAIELAPSDVSSRFQLGTLSVELGRFDVARQQLERCTQLSPDFSDGWAQLSALQTKLGELSAGEKTLMTGLRNCPNSPGLHLMRARALQKAGRNDEAIGEFRISAQLRPNEPDAFLELGNLLLELGQVDAGMKQIHAALEAEPGNPVAMSTLAFHAILSGDEASAREWLARVKDQPRVRQDQRERLLAAYQQQFGRAWAP